MDRLPSAPVVVLPPAWYDGKSPEVSIIVLNYNRADLTRVCLEHLWAHTMGHRYEIIVVDNGSESKNIELLCAVVGPFRLVRLEVNRFFGEGNNIGVEAARGTYVVFLHNDTFVTEGWLRPLVRRLEGEPLLGGVGPRLLYPDGRVQEAGAFVDADGDVVEVGKLGAYAPDDIEEDHIVDYISAACFVTHRDLCLAVGGFEYTYEPAYYEDVDLCLKITARGRMIAYCAESRVIHIEGATSGSNPERLGLTNIIEPNRVKFLKFWGDGLAAREQAVITEVAPSRPHFTRPRAVFYTAYELTPGGGERYLLTAATALLPQFEVHLATEETYSRTRLRAIGRDLSLDLHGIELVERRNLAQVGPIDISVILSNEVVPPFPGFAPRNIYICQFPFPVHWAEDIRRFGNLNSFVETIVYSEFVRGSLQAKRDLLGIGEHPIGIVAPPVPQASPCTQPAPLELPYRLVLIGRFFAGGHNKRHDVAIEAVRRLTAAGLPVELDLVGSLPPQQVHRDLYTRLLSLSDGLPVLFHPNATPATLHGILSRSHIYIHAAGYNVDPNLNPHECEHFGISVLEAMSYGLAPFVVANGGPPSFIVDGLTGYTYSTVEELSTKLIAALDNPDELAALRAAAIARSAQYNERAFISSWQARASALIS